MKVSIRDLSKMTGFSPATISNALNHKKGVNKDTAEEIFRIARETGYLSANAVTKIRLVIFKKNGRIIEDIHRTKCGNKRRYIKFCNYHTV